MAKDVEAAESLENRGERGTSVRRRTVFYISGYDPRGASHYHRLYKTEAAKQMAINGFSPEVGPRRTVDDHESAWTIAAANTTTTYRFLRYDDIMRKRWSKSTPAVIRDILHYAAALLERGVFARVLRLSWPMFATIVYAPVLLLAALLIAVLAALAVAWLAPWGIALAAGLAAFIGCLALRPLIEPHSNAFWLARILSFIADQGAGREPAIEPRIDSFAARIARTLEDGEADEVLVIGHSVGTQLGVCACARALAKVSDRRARLSLLTLGHTIPLLGLQPPATAFRAELIAVAADPRCDWIDVSAAIDSACFPLTDPVMGCGLRQTDPAAPKPKLVSARFPKLFSPASYAVIRRDFHRAHFQYLMAAEIAGDYDYFLITAGAQTLSERFAHLASISHFNRFRLSRA